MKTLLLIAFAIIVMACEKEPNSKMVTIESNEYTVAIINGTQYTIDTKLNYEMSEDEQYIQIKTVNKCRLILGYKNFEQKNYFFEINETKTIVP